MQKSNASPIGQASQSNLTSSPHQKDEDIRGDLLVNVHTYVHTYVHAYVAVAAAELRCHAALAAHSMPRRHASFTQQLILTTTTIITL